MWNGHTTCVLWWWLTPMLALSLSCWPALIECSCTVLTHGLTPSITMKLLQPNVVILPKFYRINEGAWKQLGHLFHTFIEITRISQSSCMCKYFSLFVVTPAVKLERRRDLYALTIFKFKCSLTHWGRNKMAAIFQTTFSNGFPWMKIYEFRLNFHWRLFLEGTINNIPTLVQVMAWHRPGDKPLSEPMMVSLPTQLCVTRPHWVKCLLWN